MNRALFSFTLLCCLYVFGFSQSAPITIDGKFDDWTNDLQQHVDADETLNNVDLLSFQVTNDEEFLFIKLELDTEINLKEDDPVNHSIYLYLDADNNASTGLEVQNGFGADLGLNFSDLSGDFHVSPSVDIPFAAVSLRMGPTITSTIFEIAIARDAVPDYIHPLFSGNTVKILFKNWSNGDELPDEDSPFSYTFDDTPVDPYIPIALEKSVPEQIRLVAYNTLFNGLTIQARQPHFERILKALDPDIIAFSECYDTPVSTVQGLLDDWLPTVTTDGWHLTKVGDLITASRWPILQTWPFIYRSYPVLIDLPETYPRDILVTNSHLSCCGNNTDRQLQIDEYNAFFKQLKEEGAGLGFTELTPFIYAGDMNLVGYAEQLNSLLTGDIVNINQFGTGAAPDWDGTDIQDELSLQTDKRMAYTWRNDFSSYPPGRLDYIIYSDYTLQVEKSFVLQTEIMPSNRLAQYNLNANDTGSASDHFPVVADFSITVFDQVQNATGLQPNIYPNPVSEKLTIELPSDGTFNVILLNAQGKRIGEKANLVGKQAIDVAYLPGGIYFLVTESEGKEVFRYKFVKE